MRAFVITITVVLALMEPAADADEVARCAFGTTELDVRPQLDDHVVEFST
jgi:hypothetical protein